MHSGDPSTSAWFRDRQRVCRQALSPYEMSLAPVPRSRLNHSCAEGHPLTQGASFCDEGHPAAEQTAYGHPEGLTFRDIPLCDEPVARGYNPLRLCALHLALRLEEKRLRGQKIMPPDAPGGGLLLDFVEGKVYLDDIRTREDAARLQGEERAQLDQAHAEHLARLAAEAEGLRQRAAELRKNPLPPAPVKDLPSAAALPAKKPRRSRKPSA